MKLTEGQWAALRWLSRQRNLVWGGLFVEIGDPDVAALVAYGLCERVERPYTAGRAVFPGGFIITPAGTQALQDREGA